MKTQKLIIVCNRPNRELIAVVFDVGNQETDTPTLKVIPPSQLKGVTHRRKSALKKLLAGPFYTTINIHFSH